MLCMYVCIYLSIYVSMYVCMYVCTYVRTYVCIVGYYRNGIYYLMVHTRITPLKTGASDSYS